MRTVLKQKLIGSQACKALLVTPTAPPPTNQPPSTPSTLVAGVALSQGSDQGLPIIQAQQINVQLPPADIDPALI